MLKSVKNVSILFIHIVVVLGDKPLFFTQFGIDCWWFCVFLIDILHMSQFKIKQTHFNLKRLPTLEKCSQWYWRSLNGWLINICNYSILHNEKLCGLCRLPSSIVRIGKCTKLWWAGHVAKMREKIMSTEFWWENLMESSHLEYENQIKG